ncbi:MAG: hypothetical protein WC595_05845 [Candidatus Nanoarchaeia archaeon]
MRLGFRRKIDEDTQEATYHADLDEALNGDQNSLEEYGFQIGYYEE